MMADASEGVWAFALENFKAFHECEPKPTEEEIRHGWKRLASREMLRYTLGCSALLIVCSLITGNGISISLVAATVAICALFVVMLPVLWAFRFLWWTESFALRGRGRSKRNLGVSKRILSNVGTNGVEDATSFRCRKTSVTRRSMKCRKQNERILTDLETHLMRAFGLTDVRELDKMFAAPISEEAALQNEPPDEIFDLAEEADEELERRYEAKEQFGALFETKFLN